MAGWAYFYLAVIPYEHEGRAAFHYWSYVFFASLGIAGYLAVRRIGRRDNELLHTSITGNEPGRIEPAATPLAVKRHLAERAHILQSLIIRASAEWGGVSVDEFPRQISNDLLRRQMLWGELERSEWDLLSAPTGIWTDEQRGEAVIWCEQLRLLRWVSGIDRELTSLAHFPVPDAQLIQALPGTDAIANSGKWLVGLDVNMERSTTVEYEYRAVAELVTRSMVPAAEDLLNWAELHREAMAGDSTDLLAGTQAIASLSDEALRVFACICVARDQYCSYLRIN